MITIIADTQNIAKRYARTVGACDEDTRHYVGNNYAVTWLEGIDLGFSPDLAKTLDSLSPTELPFFPDRYPVVLLPADGHLKPSEKMTNYARILSELIANSTYVYVATSDLQATLLKAGPMLVTVPKGFLFQLHLRSLSAKGIRESLQNRLQIRGVQQKYEQALKKEKAEWLISANSTHLLEKVYGKGSHQIDPIATPLLSLICRRFKANKEHESKSTWQVNFSIEKDGEVYKFTSDKQFDSVADANALYIKMRKAMGEEPVIISDVSVKTEVLHSPGLFDYHTILLAANKYFGFGVVHTTKCLQKLFDNGLITWPFTKEYLISQNYARQFWNNTVHDLRSNSRWEQMILKIDQPNQDCIWDYCGKRDHIGICLTERKCNPDVFKLTKDEQRIYDLITERMILAFGQNAQMKTSTVWAFFEGHEFKVEKSVLTEKGWTAMINRKFGNTETPYTNYHWHEGELEHFYGVSITKRTSQPIPLHTAETLLMEADLFDLGTTKEKADAVNMLFENGYIDAFDKEIVPTEKGLALYSVIRDMIIGSPLQMGHFNRRLSLGLYSKAQISNYTEAVVRELLSSETLFAKRAVPIDRATKKMIDNIKEEAS